MFLFAFLLCCVLQPILHNYCVFGKRKSLKRFVVEDGAKPAIFGSYSYDPVRQVFVPPPTPVPNDVNGTSKDHTPPHSHTEKDIQAHTQADPMSHQLTSTPSDTPPSQSLPDSFISTAGDTGTDSPDEANKMLRKHEALPNNKPWWERPKTPFKNLTFNILY